ncbi:anhydro-N-acetylmuramic acid kinase [Allohahella sp. A8]|uniref:anhydro-N-acetylmuramic acid kinase n=1 Tax=Allohahella sp. A8 TaxID=3141461 RepID=UPI000C09DBFB|nr:anhydro-N-acetylmuramic acid kinase [Hahellaceae bacterium]
MARIHSQTCSSTDSALYIGQMSGTSLDGLDTVIAELAPGQPPRILYRSYLPFESQLASALRRLATASTWSVAEYLEIEHAYTLLSASCIQDLLKASGISPADINAIGCHGQTIRHQTSPQVLTHQLLDGALIAEQTGVTTICDFRSRDIAAGGQGAPLLPAFLAAAFQKTLDETICFLNLGGIANICYRDAERKLRGFDTGPASTLLNHCSRMFFNTEYDAEGAHARRGVVDESLLKRLLSDAYFDELPPKSTGPERFSLEWLQQRAPEYFCDSAVVSGENLLATLTELTALSVINQIRVFVPQCRRLIAYGGGVHNVFLMERLKAAFSISVDDESQAVVETSDELGLDGDMMEATAFAWLAQQCLERRPVACETVTGSRGARVLGCIYPA